ncbi:MAG: hypothetical protein JXO51_05865 [Candidatus Aminicenantes bacterium]|nr:hypothetical protein [Candidatus Aminicenantes bacterium]
MKKIVLLLPVLLLFSACICKPILGGLPEGRQVKVNIQDKTFRGELLSVTPELIIIRFLDEEKKQDVILGCPVPETEVVKVKKGCGPIGNLFAKNRKFTFKNNTPEKINENIVDLSHDSLYASKMPDWVKEQLTLFDQL